MENILNLEKDVEFDKNLCFICQLVKRGVKTSKPTGDSFEKLKIAAEKRKNLGEINIIFDRIDLCLQNGSTSNIVWHKDCFGNFKKEQHIKRLIPVENSVLPQNKKIKLMSTNKPITRSKVPSFDFKKCAFCQVECKKKGDLIRTESFDISKLIKDNSKFNLRLHIALSTVSDTPAADFLYHLNCYVCFKYYVEKSKKKEQNTDYALIYILEELEISATKGDLILLDDVWERYEDLANEYNTLSNSYKSKKTFCICLKKKISHIYHFANKAHEMKTIMFPIAHLNGGISKIIQQNENEIEESFIPKYQSEDHEEFLALVHVALRLRSNILEKQGHKGISVTENAAINCIPDNLNLFLSILFGGQEILDIGENESFDRGNWTKNVMMCIAQDMIFGVSKGKKLTAKHIGLTSTLHQKTRSKELVNLFYQAGHCLSYDTLLKLDATLAMDTLKSLDKKTGTVIPQNIVRGGGLIHYSADNIDIKDGGSLDGKNTFNALQMAAYQRNDVRGSAPFSHIQELSKKQAIKVPDELTRIEKVFVIEKVNPIDGYTVDLDSFKTNNVTYCHTQALALDNAFYFSRQNTVKRIGWTEFNQKCNTKSLNETTIGHMPMILNPASDYDTLNLVIRRCMAVSSHFGQKYTVITVDQQLYCKLHTLISNVSDFKDVVIPRLGGFHISLNFLKVIGQHMSGCGLLEAWIECEILGEVAAQKVFAGKDYNKGMRIHKLTVQVLWRILIPFFLKFLRSRNPNLAKTLEEEIKKLGDGVQSDIDLKVLFQIRELNEYLETFVKEECDKSANFTFWWKYMDMVSTLLMFTRAQRDGLWDLYLFSFKKMIPFFFLYDHYNYARWGVIYAAQMMQIPDELKEEFVKGNFVVKGSNQSFCQVDPDQAQEWQNRICKIAGGIVGITRTYSALMKWVLSFNARSYIADQTYRMFGLKMDKLVTKETMDFRKNRDNMDEDKLFKQLTSFKIFEESSEDLINIANKDMATIEIEESLLNAEEKGFTKMKEFITRITKDTGQIEATEFHKSIDRNNTKTFDHLYLRTVRSKEKDEKFAYKADRRTLVRIIAAKHFGMDVNLESILCSEIIPVPLSIADINGNLRPGDKAYLQKRLLEGIYCPEKIDLAGKSSCLLIDGQALVFSLGRSKEFVNFGQIADNFISSILQQGYLHDRIDVVFDRYREKSIKNNTRNRRTLKHRPIRKHIDSRCVILPQDWQNYMASSDNKSDYADFLSREIKSKAQYEKKVVTSGGFKEELEVWASCDNIDISKLSSTQEEADTRLILHAINSNYNYIVVSSRDTDVLVLLISHFHRMNCTELWMKCGTQKQPKYIPIHDIVSKMSPNALKALIPFHTLTGCDTTSFLAQHTKWSAWDVLKSDANSLLIQNLGEDSFDESDFIKIEKFFCILYGMPNENDINKVRVELFLRNRIPEALPPTKDALYLHIKRAHYQSLVWKKANFPRPTLPEVTELGWKMSDGKLKPILMTKSAIPDDELKLTSCSCTTGCNTNRCGCKKMNLLCNINCKCVNDECLSCTNAPSLIGNDEEEDDYLEIMP